MKKTSTIKSAFRCKFLILLLGIVISVTSTPSSFAVDNNASSRIQGTFLQLLSHHGEWNQEKWAALFAQFQELGLSRLVVQWTLHEDLAFFQTSEYNNLSSPPLEHILRLADTAGMDVYVGLYHDPKFWDNINRDPILVEHYLRKIRHHSTVLSEKLQPLLKNHSSFRGWYITEEIDDISWQMPNKGRALLTHLNLLTKHLHMLTPNKKVAISGFSNAATDPQTFEAFWSSLLQATSIDVVLFQDGIGVNKLGLRELPLYLGAIRNAASINSRELLTVIEIFSQTEGQPINSNPFFAIPAPLDRIERQLQISSEYSGSNIAFSIPEYMNKQGNAQARELYERYQSHISAIAPERARQ